METVNSVRASMHDEALRQEVLRYLDQLVQQLRAETREIITQEINKRLGPSVPIQPYPYPMPPYTPPPTIPYVPWTPPGTSPTVLPNVIYCDPNVKYEVRYTVSDRTTTKTSVDES